VIAGCGGNSWVDGVLKEQHTRYQKISYFVRAPPTGSLERYSTFCQAIKNADEKKGAVSHNTKLLYA